MECTLYLWHSSKKKVAVDLHLVVLADQDGAHVVLVVQLRGGELVVIVAVAVSRA